MSPKPPVPPLHRSSRPVSALCVLLASSAAVAQALPERSDRIGRYGMAVELLPETRTVRGTQRISWRNATGAPTSELRFHLYLNAFRPGSSLMRESDEQFRGLWRKDEYGGIELESLQLEDASGAAIELETAFVQPDDDNAADRTVLRAVLPRPVGPGETIELRCRFVSKLPKAYRRTGWLPANGFFCMHWYPKLGVLQQVGTGAEWNCHQFHASTEFFADFTEYEVSIDVPAEFVVGATGGLPVDEKIHGTRKTLTFRQADVHDFAFVADPDFRVHEGTFEKMKAADDPTGVAPTVARRMGVPIDTFDLPETKIRLLLQPQHDTETQVDRHMRAARAAIEFYGLRYGPYPYGIITLVDPGIDMLGRRLGGGMEYPTLITCGTQPFTHPRQMRPEGVVVHEFGHQYWYGLSANNEFEEAWLDEGINSYSEGRAQGLYYGETSRPVETTSYGLITLAAVPGLLRPEGGLTALRALPLGELLPAAAQRKVDALRFEGSVLPDSPLLDLVAAQPTLTGFREVSFSNAWSDRKRMLALDNPDAMVRRGWEYASAESYHNNSYQRPATLLRTLERMTGRDEWWTFLRRFHAEARFGHPTTDDFIAMLAAECGLAQAEFFRAATKAGAVFDYGVQRVSPEDGSGPRKTVTVRRYGGLRADVRVRFRFAGLSEPVWRTFPAANDYPWTEFTFDVDETGQPYGRLLEVWVDPPRSRPDAALPDEGAAGPAGVFLIDENLLNNGWRAVPDRRPALYRGLRMLLQTQSQLTFAGLIG